MTGIFFFTITSIFVIIIVYTIIIFFSIPRERSFSREKLAIFSEGFPLKHLALTVIAHLKRVELLILDSVPANFISRSLGFCRIQFLLPCWNEYL